jgi:DNA-binding transcriptional ArsR family regulator
LRICHAEPGGTPERPDNFAFLIVDIWQSLTYLLSMSSSGQVLDRMLHAVADPVRRRILQALKERGGCSLDKDVGLCGTDIEQRIHLSQPTISHHMAILKKAGLVETQKLGQWKWYRRNEKAMREFSRALRKSL